MVGPFRDERSIINKRYRQLDAPRAVRLVSGGYMSYRRRVFNEFQFEGRLWGHRWCSTIDFSYRVSARYRVVIDPRVRVRHRNVRSSDRPEQWMRVRVAGAFFFFARNIPKSAVNWACFVWLLLAILMRGMWLAFTTGQARVAWRAFMDEWRNGLRFLRDPFVAAY